MSQELKAKIKQLKIKIQQKPTEKRLKKLKKLKQKLKVLKIEKIERAYDIMKEPINGLPIVTKDGHPLQCLLPKSEEELAKQTNVTLLLFYAYVEPEWSLKEHEEALEWAQTTGSKFNMTGRLRIAREGFNGTMTGPTNDTRRFCQAMREWKPLIFGQTDFKLTDNLPKGQLFPQLKAFKVNELVNYGLHGNQPNLNNGGVHLSAKD